MNSVALMVIMFFFSLVAILKVILSYLEAEELEILTLCLSVFAVLEIIIDYLDPFRCNACARIPNRRCLACQGNYCKRHEWILDAYERAHAQGCVWCTRISSD